TTNVEELQLIAIMEAAEVLGISENTLRQWICYGRFPHVKVGRRTMVAVQDLAKFVEQNHVGATLTKD
ncbi:MAG: helix-turn-helix domain-containing protein, partial [Nitrososphaerales archaeon]